MSLRQSYLVPLLIEPMHEESLLTDTQRKVLEHLSRDDCLQTIADKLGMSLSNVKYHCRCLCERLEVSVIRQAVAEGFRRKLIQ